MPIYEYRCPRCGVFEATAAMNRCAAPAPCPECGTSAARVISAPHLARLSSSQRRAHERNEKSADEPRRVDRHACDANCSHRQEKNRHRIVRQTPGKRPWMLGH